MRNRWIVSKNPEDINIGEKRFTPVLEQTTLRDRLLLAMALDITRRHGS